ncbi:ABC transporter permease [Pseudooceanicola nanhaiensis]|uniref:ABC transporter permease n=1 Tax=Pseudooceanicola nanhaiensis TaxID=375761 RepID=UPI001CD1CCFF|nr:ABC transporter permease [Pseudooceanicola nanhaiensis]MCA0920818.1 ABC transporter permease [Pseudooceanicola nanhaiensis]
MTALAFFHRRGWIVSPLTAACFAVILFWGTVALLAPWLIRYPIGEIVDYDYFSPVSSLNWLGSDYMGRDMYSRILMGARLTIGISLAGTVLAGVVGVAFGMIAGTIGGLFDQVLSRCIDAFVGIPNLLLALVIVAAGGSSIPVLILSVAVIFAPSCYRFSRSMAVNVGAMDFVVAARARGEGIVYLIRSEVLPNIIGPVLADMGLTFVKIVLLLSGLSFLGLGVQPPAADWGGLVRENMIGLSYGAAAVVFPCIAIASLTLAINMLIDNLPRRIRDRSPQ